MSDSEPAEPSSPRAFRWVDLLELAQEFGAREDEASLRCAVSRSYYAVFNTAREVLEVHDPEYQPMRSQDSHQQVWRRLAALGRRQAKTAARKGRSLLHKRKNADYVLTADDWPRQSEQALEEAHKTILALTDLLE